MLSFQTTYYNIVLFAVSLNVIYPVLKYLFARLFVQLLIAIWLQVEVCAVFQVLIDAIHPTFHQPEMEMP